MKKSISISSKGKIKVFKVNFKKRISLLCTVLITVTSLFAYVPPKAYAADITADARGTEEQEELDKNAYPFMEDTGETSDSLYDSEQDNAIWGGEGTLCGADSVLSGIYVMENNNSHILAGAVLNDSSDINYEYRWIACKDGTAEWFEIIPWTENQIWLDWTPDSFGTYVIDCQVRRLGEESYSEAFVSAEYHKYIIGSCQMPYEGEGGGFLIGFESCENQNQKYKYEMLILDCTLYAQGLPAWVYTTGACLVPDKCLWTIWQPEYGYYWTLFRLLDENDNIIDEVCYGFQNVPVQKQSWETTYGYSVIEPYLDDILASCTNSSMTSEQKLRSAYLYVVNNYNYRTLSANHPADFTASEYYAYVTMTTSYGNCYGFSSVFYYLALKLGYDACWYSGSVGTRKDPHGWVEINGLIFDPELERYNKVNLYGVTNGHPYKYWY